jgi:hypothetical protein
VHCLFWQIQLFVFFNNLRVINTVNGSEPRPPHATLHDQVMDYSRQTPLRQATAASECIVGNSEIGPIERRYWKAEMQDWCPLTARAWCSESRFG